MGRIKCMLPILLAFFSEVICVPRVDPLVDTKVGFIKGVVASDGDYSMFLGIPYATVDPLNPFGPSAPHEGFETTFNAVDKTAACPQIEEFNNTVIGTLDCLHLNVYVPHTASSRNLRPVLVWIHGGGFTTGFGTQFTQGPKFLIRHDIIVVTLNYRLGAYGFLCTDVPEVPGNQGMKDQLLALRWIKDNIEAFGGDSSQITLFGESAGGAAVDLQRIYGQEDLFNKIIIQSGNALVPFAVKGTDPTAPIKLAAHLGFITDDVKTALEFLRTIDTNLVVAAAFNIGIQIAPCVENEFENVERFIADYPVNVNLPESRSMPILIGITSNEFGHRFENYDPDEFKNLEPFNTISESFYFDDEYYAKMVANLRQFYIGDEEISIETKELLGDYESDWYFNHPTHRSINKYFENGASKIYQYMFSYNGNRNIHKIVTGAQASGAIHADELGYLFDIDLLVETPSPEDQHIIDRITTLWTNFVKYGDPTPEVTDLLPVQWPIVTNEARYYYDINTEISIKQRAFHDRMAFWDLFFKLNWSYLRGIYEN